MAGKSQYSEADKARVYVALATNDGMVKRAARETGVPETTVRRWKEEFEKHGPPSEGVVETVVGEFLEKAEAVQWKALQRLEEKIDANDVTARDLITTVGVLNDKITRMKGLPSGRVDHHHHLPPAEELRELLTGLGQGALEQGRQQRAELVEAEIVEQPVLGLPAPRP